MKQIEPIKLIHLQPYDRGLLHIVNILKILLRRAQSSRVNLRPNK